MARLFTCGFEENNVVANEAMWTRVDGGAVTIGAVSPHSGTYRLNTAAGAGASHTSRILSAAKTTGTLYSRIYFRANDATPSLTTFIIFWGSSALLTGIHIDLTTGGTLNLVNDTAVTTSSGAVVLSNDTWYRLELRVLLSNTNGDSEYKLYDDTGALLENITNGSADQDTLPTNLQYFRLGKTASVSTFSYDDVAINDDTNPGDGSNMTWCGPGKIYMLVPNSDVAITWEDDAGGTNNATFANIDGFGTVPPTVDDTDYNASDTLLDVADALGDDDRFGLTNLGAEVASDATIMLADVYGRVGSNQTSASHLNFLLWDESGTLTTGPTCTVNVNGFRMVATNEHLVYNATGKTKANFDSFNVGYEPITDVLALRPRRVSELWVNVEWTEAGITAAQFVPAIQDSCEMIGMRNV